MRLIPRGAGPAATPHFMIAIFLDASDPRLEYTPADRKLPLTNRREVAVYCDGPNWLESVTEIPQPQAGLLIASLLGCLGEVKAREAVTDFFKRHTP